MDHPNPFEVITSWFRGKCNGVWEHEFGVEIRTLDNPGWALKLTGEFGKKLVVVENYRAEEDWIHVAATSNTFSGFGGANNLEELLMHAVDWLQPEKLTQSKNDPLS